MSIIIKLYGDLKKKISLEKEYNGIPKTIEIEIDNSRTILDILKKFNIEENEISHTFVNGNLCGLGIKIKDGDRIGLFPKRMGIMFAEIPLSNSIQITIKLSDDLRKYGLAEAIVNLPNGSTINSILKKFRIPNDKRELLILLNGKPCSDKNSVVEKGNIIEFFLK